MEAATITTPEEAKDRDSKSQSSISSGGVGGGRQLRERVAHAHRQTKTDRIGTEQGKYIGQQLARTKEEEAYASHHYQQQPSGGQASGNAAEPADAAVDEGGVGEHAAGAMGDALAGIGGRDDAAAGDHIDGGGQLVAEGGNEA